MCLHVYVHVCWPVVFLSEEYHYVFGMGVGEVG